MSDYDVLIEENKKLLRLIDQEPAWALSRVQRASELETRLESLRQELEDLRETLQWIMQYAPRPTPDTPEYAEHYGAATRLAWPDQPENWS